MSRLFCSFLFLYVYIGTKCFNVDKTLLSVRWLGTRLRDHVIKTQKPIEEIDRDIKAAYRLIPFRLLCLDLAIVYWFYLNMYGYHATLKIGCSIFPVFSHAWVQCGHQIFVDAELLADLSITATYEGWSWEGKPVEVSREVPI